MAFETVYCSVDSETVLIWSALVEMQADGVGAAAI